MQYCPGINVMFEVRLQPSDVGKVSSPTTPNFYCFVCESCSFLVPFGTKLQ